MPLQKPNDSYRLLGICSRNERWYAGGIVKQFISIAKSSIEVEDRKWQKIYYPFDDYSGSKLEAAENNWNDNIMKMVERDWDWLGLIVAESPAGWLVMYTHPSSWSAPSNK